ncbi:hypothetical protein GWK48_01385 [Metallosphaera tengchongensis]|uniref:DUF8155 domain-containing protein n=1 Tax=Metallosphaera tengchongensis TaxID=1532350 RepID=A0A6N0NSZ4_9CREN|nr:hypothetical protein [Metallosphaera tengchongensis]QKQ99226.1 hypothetical protein GWK48_01385 [Metallosphaera tengchongensis]
MNFEPGTLVSFFTSGFSSHVKAKAIDVGYPSSEEFVSFLSGEILSVEKFNVGRPNVFATVNYDYKVILKSKNRYIKILHVEPYLSPGEQVKRGDVLGRLISSPYTGGDFKHAHVEGLPLSFPKVTRYQESGAGVVVNRTESFFDVKLTRYTEAGDIRGLGCCGGILNASLPYAGYGGLIGVEVKGNINLLGKRYFTKVKKSVTLIESRRGLLKNWDYGPAFKVMRNEPIDGPPLLESVLSFKGEPMVRLFMKTDAKEGDEIDVWSTIGNYLARKV